MSIKVQKIIRFIPIVNFIALFCWIGCCFKYGTKMKEYFITMLKLFSAIILLNIPRLIVYYTVENYIVNQVFFWVTVYFSFLALAWISINAQEKLINNAKAEMSANNRNN